MNKHLFLKSLRGILLGLLGFLCGTQLAEGKPKNTKQSVEISCEFKPTTNTIEKLYEHALASDPASTLEQELQYLTLVAIGGILNEGITKFKKITMMQSAPTTISGKSGNEIQLMLRGRDCAWAVFPSDNTNREIERCLELLQLKVNKGTAREVRAAK